MQRRIVDLSYPLDQSTPPFPGDAPVEITVQMSIPADLAPGTPGHLNTSVVRASLHTGTHMDAFFHFYHGRLTIDRIPLAQCMGQPCCWTSRINGPKRRSPRMIWRPFRN